MKILPFEPHQIKSPAREGGRPNSHQTLSFESELKNSQSAPTGLDAVISENLKAAGGASQEDLGQAGCLLQTLLAQIKSVEPQELRKVHNLDGILYYYRV
jgi:hypothetical protein